MMDYFSVDIPVFVPSYDEKKLYGWSRYKDDLWDLLKDTTGGYCMYCYDTVWINGQRRGQIEHGIEKINSPEYLTDCVPNLGWLAKTAMENIRKEEKKEGNCLKSRSGNLSWLPAANMPAGFHVKDT